MDHTDGAGYPGCSCSAAVVDDGQQKRSLPKLVRSLSDDSGLRRDDKGPVLISEHKTAGA